MKLIKKDEEVRVFKSETAFYSYIDRKLNANGYILIETCPVLEKKIKTTEGYPIQKQRNERRD
ncbi:MAG: hypothetical protein JHC32_02675 [Candidatus Aminicenantes bacterium]|nr:hypothetical protein [Candidatus Aminicenantes bacterium]